MATHNWGKGHGDVWTWVAMDADSKLVITWTVGGRDQKYGNEFASDLADPLTDRVQLTSDGWQATGRPCERRSVRTWMIQC